MTQNGLVIDSIEPDIQKKAALILAVLGLTAPEACQIFLKKVVEERASPFELDKIPNQETIEAMEELESGGGKAFDSEEEFFKRLGW
ncbi:MAG: type II toxin-antitoxin system RelB/DinJ family antitoxin [Deltaproteobacteria bacterium]|nr:type II toxin-antitoxin system RelB/DinJ family antitoxin [Deltaproteobacteria bacterium]